MPADLSSAEREVAGYRVVSELPRQPRVGAAYEVVADDGRRVELWVLPAPDQSFARNFLEDAGALADLADPHLPRIVDYGETPESVYVATEPIAATGLDQLIHERGPLAPMRVIRLLGEAADGLDAGHRAGVSHRHLSPAALLVVGQPVEHAILHGFGLGERSSGRDGQADDLHAFARLMFECFTGSRPRGDTPASEIRPELPEGLDPVLARGFCAEARANPTTAAALVADAAKALLAAGRPSAPTEAPAQPASEPRAEPTRTPAAAPAKSACRRAGASPARPFRLRSRWWWSPQRGSSAGSSGSPRPVRAVPRRRAPGPSSSSRPAAGVRRGRREAWAAGPWATAYRSPARAAGWMPGSPAARSRREWDSGSDATPAGPPRWGSAISRPTSGATSASVAAVGASRSLQPGPATASSHSPAGGRRPRAPATSAPPARWPSPEPTRRSSTSSTPGRAGSTGPCGACHAAAGPTGPSSTPPARRAGLPRPPAASAGTTRRRAGAWPRARRPSARPRRRGGSSGRCAGSRSPTSGWRTRPHQRDASYRSARRQIDRREAALRRELRSL